MKRSSATKRRRVLRFATPLLLAIAILSYAAELIHLRAASAEAREGFAFVQALGSAATLRTRATVEHESESVLIDGRRGAGAAAWQLAAGERSLLPGSQIERADVFIADADLRFSSNSGFADILVDGRRIARVGGRQIRVAGDEQIFAVPDADAVPIGIPPGQRLGFRFPIASGDACRSHDCTIGIVLHDARWNVRSVAVLFTTANVAETPAPLRPASALWIGLAIVAFAVLSHIVLSFVRVSFRSGGEAAQT